jgi:hydrogenase maturation protease
MKMLVIGYGNELRQDDGVGPRVARTVAGWQRPNLEGVAVYQLTPELAERVSQVDRVLFVDAVHGSTLVQARLLEPDQAAPSWSHTCDPQSLLALAEALYGSRPNAWLMEVPAPCLGFGEELSSLAERGLQAALEQIRQLADMEQPCTRSV